jgi:hypothetical protein
LVPVRPLSKLSANNIAGVTAMSPAGSVIVNLCSCFPNALGGAEFDLN